jgi:hypothetical protein
MNYLKKLLLCNQETPFTTKFDGQAEVGGVTGFSYHFLS